MIWTGMKAAEQTFRMMSLCVAPDAVISGYPEYATASRSLDARQRSELNRAAQTIVSSLFTRSPIRAFIVIGHADKALRKAPHERPAFEREVSQRRADSALEALLQEMVVLAGGPAIKYLVHHRAIGVGNLRPVVLNAATEEQMRRNRRVEIVFARTLLSEPSCAV